MGSAVKACLASYQQEDLSRATSCRRLLTSFEPFYPPGTWTPKGKRWHHVDMKNDPVQNPPHPVSPVAPAIKKIAVSAGVIAGNKLGGTTPQYPPIAKAARIQGTVVLKVEISTTGIVQELNVISGPPELQQSALEAVKTYRYKPYLLDSEPVIVETQVDVVYKLN
jgi:TonB family protein